LELCYKELADRDLPDTWFTSYIQNNEFRLFEVVRQSSSCKPMVIVHMLLIQNDLTWQVYVADHLVPTQSLIIKDIPPRVSRNCLPDLLSTVFKANIALGTMRKDLLFWHMQGRESFCQ